VRIVVFGAGAVGSRFAAALARAGDSVLVVGRPAHVVAIAANGLVVDGEPGPPVRIEARSELPAGVRADVVLLTVKSYDVEVAGRAIANAFPHPVPVVALSNGLGIEAALAKGLAEGGWRSPGDWTIRGVHTVPARLVGPGHVAPTGSGVWRKALVNAAINPVTADHGIPNGRLAEEPWRGQALGLLREALQAAAAEGYPFDPAESERAVFGVVRATAENRSSMLEDLEHGRPTEVEAISGALLAAGRRHGIPMPATERAIVRIHTREAERRARG
jgi:2-dehydropantoate 2-reductase